MRLRRIALTSVLSAGLAGGSAVVFGAHPATPTTPASGTLNSGTVESLPFEAPLRAGAATGPGDCVGPNCSDFDLFVANPGGKNVRVRIDWTLVTNDFDLYVYEQAPGGEEQVASSGAGATTFEEAVFTPKPNTAYQIVIVHFAVAVPDNIEGVVSLVNPPTVKQPSRIGPTGTGIVFSPNGHIQTPLVQAPSGKGTVAAPEASRDGEPSIRADVRGNVYPAGIRGVPAGVDVWRFGPNAYCPRFTWHDDEEFSVGDPPSSPNNPAAGYVWLGQPDGIFVTDGEGSPDAGGGDIELAVSNPALPGATPTLSMVSLTLANITSAASFNRGNTWTPANPVAATVPLDDRQWIEAYGPNTVYLYYRTLATLTGLVLNKSIDGGVTYAASTSIVNPLGYTPGWIDVDQTPNPNGSVDIYLSAQNSSELVVFHCVDPTPALPSFISCTQSSVDKTMSHGHIFDVVSVDSADNVYAAWSNNRDVFYAYSTNKGATWSSPIAVTNSGTGGMPTTNIFPWITAGDNGRLGIVWYGTDAPSHADNSAEWKAYYAFTANARAATPILRWLPASDHVNHVGNISQAGFSPNETAVNRNLIDFFQLAHDPRDGAAVIAFGDDHNDFDGHTYYTRQIRGPGLRANRNPTQPDCPPLSPYRDPEVVDFTMDEAVSADAMLPQPDIDILSIDYGSERTSGQLYLTATFRVTGPVLPLAGRSYRAYFAVNAPRGLMDKGNEYFIELTTETGPPQYFLGVKDRRNDGTTAEKRVENITADQLVGNIQPGPPGTIRIRVRVNRLDYCYDGDTNVHQDNCSPRPGDGSLVLGLMGRTRIATPLTTSVVDETRGGSWIIVGRRDDGGGGGDDDGDDDDDFDDDGERDDTDNDDDGDGEDDDADSDDDNDGVDDEEDADDDNDFILDIFDNESTRELQDLETRETASGEFTEYAMVTDASTVLLTASALAPDADPLTQPLTVEIYNPLGVLVASSVTTAGRATATTVPALPGTYTVRVHNTSAEALTHNTTLVRSQRWF
jgi:hypothetical protein